MTAIFRVHDRKGLAKRGQRLRIFVDFNTGVTRAVVGEDGTSNSKAMSVLVEEDVTLVFDKLKSCQGNGVNGDQI